MRLLFDESSGKRLAMLLSAAGHDVVYVGDVMPSAPDEDVIGKLLTGFAPAGLNPQRFVV